MRIKFVKLTTTAIAALLSFSAHASLIDNGNTTIDTSAGLEWLDLTLTVGQSYDSIVGGYGGYAALGYVHANQGQVCDLWASAGAAFSGCTQGATLFDSQSISQSSANTLVGLFGATWIPSTTGLSNAGIYDGGFLGLGEVGLACINAWDEQLCSLTVDNGPNAEIASNVGLGTGGSDPLIGNYLVRSVQAVPVPSALWLFGSGLFSLIGVARYKKS